MTVGSHYQGFERLVKKMDEIAGRIDEEVVMQIGHTDYEPVNAKFFDFLESFEEIERLNREARVVVSHAGAGSILTALEQRVPVIVVPRLKKFNEHMDDHQLEIAEAMSESSNVKVIYNINDLENILRRQYEKTGSRINQNALVNRVGKYIRGLEK